MPRWSGGPYVLSNLPPELMIEGMTKSRPKTKQNERR